VPSSDQKQMIRRHSVRIFGALLEVAGVVALAGIAFTPNDAVNGTADRLFGGGVFTVGMWVAWQLAIAPALLVEGGRVAVRNPFVRWEIDRRAIASVDWDDDTVVLLLKDGQKVRPFVLQESLIDRLMRSRKQETFKTSLEAPYRSSAGDDVIRASRIRVWASLPIAVVVWAACFLAVIIARG
jgi:hypothetical protein